MKIKDFRRVVKEPIKKDLLSRQLYIKWVQEIKIVQVLLKGLQDEEEHNYDKSSLDAEVEAPFANKPICKSCVSRYRRLCIESTNAPSDSDEDEATAAAGKAKTGGRKPHQNLQRRRQVPPQRRRLPTSQSTKNSILRCILSIGGSTPEMSILV
jgi:hypothetical protein